MSSHSNKKNNNLKSTENDNAFDIMEYILKNKKKSEVETKVNKSHHSTKTTEIIKQKSNPNKLILKRKISANLIKSNISCKKIPKETNFVLKTQKPEKVVMLKPNTVNKNNLSQKLNITSTSINVSKAINNIDKNKKSFRSSKSIPKPINQNKNEVINHNKSKSIYIPAMHSTREIRKVNGIFNIS